MVARLNRPRPLPDAAQPRVSDTSLQRAFDLLFVPLREVLRFLQPYVQREKWKPLDLLNSFQNYSGDWGVAQYRKMPWGEVQIRGLIFRASASTDAMFILPEGYRPPHRVGFTTTADNGWARIDVYEDGSVKFDGASSATWYASVFLDGLKFSTEA